uniref:Uncharacterized protein n=1 Tax=Utricularia reniformis TaxID=192314 RepID=A0A1Y0B396_9LAMI|nr:hypothetical protein AEK19_MT1635 [Utricularia reniformis]ART31819.1 hypothetical protein AEK19_MT1635 [Utricularia reniformis]
MVAYRYILPPGRSQRLLRGTTRMIRPSVESPSIRAFREPLLSQ